VVRVCDNDMCDSGFGCLQMGEVLTHSCRSTLLLRVAKLHTCDVISVACVAILHVCDVITVACVAILHVCDVNEP
jgi:hypothetical protein